MLLRPMIPPADERTDRRGRRIKYRHPVSLDDLPETVRLGLVRHPFIHQCGRSVAQRSVHRIAVAGNPAHIGSAPEKIRFLQIKDPFGCQVRPQKIAGRRMQNSLRFPCASTGIENKKRMLTIHGFGWTSCGLMRHQFVPPAVDFIQFFNMPGAL